MTMETQLSSTIIENPEMLKYQQERSRAQSSGGPQGPGLETQTPKLTNVVNGESLEDIRKVRRSPHLHHFKMSAPDDPPLIRFLLTGHLLSNWQTGKYDIFYFYNLTDPKNPKNLKMCEKVLFSLL